MDVNSPWATLPYRNLVGVFAHLSKEDQLSAAQVCKNWYEAFQCPDLWRRVKLILSSNLDDAAIQIRRTVAFTRRYGNVFRHVRIDCNILPKPRSRTILRVLLPRLMKALSRHAQLHTFILSSFGCNIHHIHSTLLTSLHDFFASQLQLEVLHLFYPDIKVEEAVLLLETVTINNGPTLKELQLSDFYSKDLKSRDAFMGVLSKLTNLCMVGLHYDFFSGNVIQVLTRYDTFRILEVSYYRSKPFDRISISAWCRLRSRCPAVTVRFAFDPSQVGTKQTTILTPSIPLQILRNYRDFIFRDDEGDSSEEESDSSEEYLTREIAFLQLVARLFATTLDAIILVYPETRPIPMDAMENLLQLCIQLKKLVITGHIPFQLFNFLMEVFLDERTALEWLEMETTVNSAATDASCVFRTYTDRLKSMDVDFTLSSRGSRHILRLTVNRSKDQTSLLDKSRITSSSELYWGSNSL